MVTRRLSVVRPAAEPHSGSASNADLGLLAFLLVIHGALLAASLVGYGSPASAGYATAVVLVGARELVLELRDRRASPRRNDPS